MRSPDLHLLFTFLLLGWMSACSAPQKSSSDADDTSDAVEDVASDVIDDTHNAGDAFDGDELPEDTTDTDDADGSRPPLSDASSPDACIPECEETACGPDGCGGSCGECSESSECIEGGCVTICDDTLESCDEPGITRCGEEEAWIETCGDVGDGCLGWIPENCPSGTSCLEGSCTETCTPSCPEETVCGDDGCGGVCGLCPDWTVCVEGGCLIDQDGDGYSVEVDCNDSNPNQNPGTPEVHYDQQDNDCDATTVDGDADGDGFIAVGMGGDDCVDNDPLIHPNALDMVGDDVDQNCDEKDGVDQDQDGSPSIASGGGDCNDNDPHIHPGLTDIPDNGVDENCDGVDGYAPPPEGDSTLCTLSGVAGAALSCPLSLARKDLADAPAVALQMNLVWDPSLLMMTQVFWVPCPLSWDCLLPSLVGVGADTLASGHLLSTSPTELPTTADQGHLSLLIHHPTEPDTPITEVHLGAGEPSSDPELFWLKFVLMDAIDDTNPAAVLIDEPLAANASFQALETTSNEGLVITDDLAP